MRRALAAGTVIALVRCTTYGAEPETTSSDAGDAAASDDGATSDASGGGIEASVAADARADAGDGAPPCSLAQNGDACAESSACCSAKCGERRVCVSSCKTSGAGCALGSTDECCVGLWCSASTAVCTPCIASGQQAAKGPFDIPLAQSCCSRALKASSSECQ